MKWWLYPKKTFPERAGPSVLALTVFAVLVIAVCIVMQAVTWPANKHVTLDFFIAPVIFPLAVMGALFNMVMVVEATPKHYEETLLFIAKKREQELTAYARSLLVIAGWSMLTPLEDPALNMLKLEGEFPQAPKNAPETFKK
jgi:hypothetical protein